MKAYILTTGRRVAPFGDPPADLLVRNRRLVEVQKETLAACGLEPAPIDDQAAASGEEFFLIHDQVYLTRKALSLFREQALGGGRSCALAIPEGRFTSFTEPLQSVREVREGTSGRRLLVYDVFYFRGEPYSLDRARELPPEPIDIREREQKLTLPPHVKETQYVGLSSAIVLHIDHWSHLLFANLLGGVAWLFELARSPRVWAWVAWRIVAAFPWAGGRLRGTFVRKGRGCSIHPKATVEGAILGDGVRIEPGAVVRASIVGSHSTIGPNAHVVGSILGERCNVGWNGIVQMCVLYPGAWSGFPGIQLALVGRDTFLASGLWAYDTSFEGTIKLRSPDGRIVTSPYHQIGSAFGHGVAIGANVSVAAGREVPNGVRIVPDLGRLLRRVRGETAPGRMYTIEGGTLVEVKGGAGRDGGAEGGGKT